MCMAHDYSSPGLKVSVKDQNAVGGTWTEAILFAFVIDCNNFQPRARIGTTKATTGA